MLAEGFVRLLRFREERKFAAAAQQRRCQTGAPGADPLGCGASDQSSARPLMVSADAGPQAEESSPKDGPRLSTHPPGVFIPGRSPANATSPVCIEDCSLLEQYPDLQVADSGLLTQNPHRAASTQHDLNPDHHLPSEVQSGSDSLPSIPDQGYLVMGVSTHTSLDLDESGLEPMSNSVLNGLLEKKLEEVYLQHLTDNLARCNSHLGNSLLHGLVPPPHPGCRSQELYSLEASLEEDSRRDRAGKISYLSTQNPCSSNFSSPVLRISEEENPHLQGSVLPPK